MLDTLPFDSIARAQNGDPNAVGELYDRYRLSIFRYLYYRTGDTQTAEDLTSEVFLRMIRALAGYRPQSAPFEAWLFQIARNLAIDHYRKTGSTRHLPLEDDLQISDPHLEADLEERLNSDMLLKALSTLDDLHRDILVLRFINGMQISQVAAALHKTEDSIKAHQRRALTALRVQLSTWEYDND